MVLLMAEFSSPLALFPVSAKITKFNSFLPLLNDVQLYNNRYHCSHHTEIYKQCQSIITRNSVCRSKKVSIFSISVENKSKITVRDFVFLYEIYSCAKSHTTRLKSTKHKIHVIKEYPLK